MRIFDYSHISDELRDNDVCNLISSIREYRGKQALFISAKPDVLKTLLEIAKIQSTAASNKIEGISTTDARLKNYTPEATRRAERALDNQLKVKGTSWSDMNPTTRVHELVRSLMAYL